LDLAGLFLMGLFGTGHCIGMCGPLIFAFPGRSGRFASHLWYHLGRVATYVAVGALLGGAGQLLSMALGLSTRADLAGMQIALRLFAAGFLLLFGLNRLGWLPEPRFMAHVRPERLPGFRAAFDSAAGARGGSGYFWIGVLLGFLPCGLSYGAFAQALGTGSLAAGGLAALAFAAGTVPGLLLLGTGVAVVVQRYRRPSDVIAGLLMLFMAAQLAVKVWRAL
jgi:hypothetical protein